MNDALWFSAGATTMWVVLYARHIWATRRQPIRRDAPDYGPWIKPEPKRRLSDHA